MIIVRNKALAFIAFSCLQAYTCGFNVKAIVVLHQ